MSMNTEIYQDISTRTAGDIYIGVVGPVRAGKSTFIKRFMETQVIPNIDNVYRRERAKDELPQSGSTREAAARSGSSTAWATWSPARRGRWRVRARAWSRRRGSTTR